MAEENFCNDRWTNMFYFEVSFDIWYTLYGIAKFLAKGDAIKLQNRQGGEEEEWKKQMEEA